MAPTGILAFGIVLDDAPWMNEEFEYNIEEWWLKINGFLAPSAKVYSNEYYKKSNEFLEKNPLVINQILSDWHDKDDYVILYMDKYIIEAFDAAAQKIDPKMMQVDKEDILVFKKFMKKYLNIDEEPYWFLTSNYL